MKSTTSAASPIPFVSLGRQYASIKAEIDDAIAAVLADNGFVGGVHVRGFEQDFAKYLEIDNVIGVANGTDALEIALEGLIPSRGEVIVPAHSFIATSEAVTRAGHDVVFADVDAMTYNIDPEDVRRRITARTKAVVAVHLYGQPADVRALGDICEEHGLYLIEDAAQAHGATYQGKRVGTWGHAACFSFYPGKNLGAYGDAGAVATDSGELATEVRRIANHGRIAKYDHIREGRNSRLDGLQAAVLSVKLRHLEAWTEHRRMIASLYRDALTNVGDIILPTECHDVRHVYHLFVVRTNYRDRLRDWLLDAEIQTGIHYPIALPRLQAYAWHPQHHEPMLATSVAEQVLSLPMSESVTVEEATRVAEAVATFFQGV